VTVDPARNEIPRRPSERHLPRKALTQVAGRRARLPRRRAAPAKLESAREGPWRTSGILMKGRRAAAGHPGGARRRCSLFAHPRGDHETSFAPTARARAVAMVSVVQQGAVCIATVHDDGVGRQTPKAGQRGSPGNARTLSSRLGGTLRYDGRRENDHHYHAPAGDSVRR